MNIYRYVYIHGLLHMHAFPCSESWEGLEAKRPWKQQAHLLLSPWLIIPILGKGSRVLRGNS